MTDTLGGYAVYVLPAYGAALAILGWLTVAAILRHRAAGRALDGLERRS
jgi:heme exporter protein CcmD